MKREYLKPTMKSVIAVKDWLCAASNVLRLDEMQQDKVQVDFRVDWSAIREGDAGTAKAKDTGLWEETNE